MERNRKGKPFQKRVQGVIIGICLLLLVGITCIGGDVRVKAGEAGSVTVTIERLTIGEGYLLKPTQIRLEAGDTYADVFVRACEKAGIQYEAAGSIEEGSFYLTAIKNGDNGKSRISSCILNMPELLGMTPPEADSQNESFPDLGERSYHDMAGWQFSVNDEFPSVGMSDSSQRPADGDVIRVQFSLYGYGADLGNNSIGEGLVLADKTDLICRAAQVRSNSSQWFSISGCRASYDQTLKVLETLDVSQEQVDSMLQELTAYRIIEPKAVALSQKELSLKRGQPPVKLGISFVPADTNQTKVSYTSSDNAVAAVTEDGTVTPKDPGTAVIQVKTSNGLSASCKVTVKKAQEQTNLPALDSRKKIKKVLNCLKKKLLETVTNPGLESQWQVIGLMRSGRSIPKSYQTAFYKNVLEKLKESEGRLSGTKYTEYSKLALSVTAVGGDASNVAGYNLFTFLSDWEKVKRQGINGPIWALLAVDSHPDYQFVTLKGTESTTREKLITEILSREGKEGGFALAGTALDVDLTAMAVQALAPYYNSQPKVKRAVDLALRELGRAQTKTGGFCQYGVENSESAAQVLVALTALGRDAETEKAFLKNGNSVIDALLSCYISGEGFSHETGGAVNAMATEQAFYALVAYERLEKGKTFLYDMSDIEKTDSKKPVENKEEKQKDSGETSVTEKPDTIENQEPHAETQADSRILAAWKGREKNFRIEGEMENGLIFCWVFHGSDILPEQEFDTQVEAVTGYEEELFQLAEAYFGFHVVQEKFPGEALLCLETTLSDGAYGLFRYDPDTKEAELVHKVTVEDGQANCILKEGGVYYIASKSRASVKSGAEEDKASKTDQKEKEQSVDMIKQKESAKGTKKEGGWKELAAWIVGAFLLAGAGCGMWRRKKNKKRTRIQLLLCLGLFSISMAGCGGKSPGIPADGGRTEQITETEKESERASEASTEEEYLDISQATEPDYSEYEENHNEAVRDLPDAGTDRKEVSEKAEGGSLSSKEETEAKWICSLTVDCSVLLDQPEQLPEGKRELLPADGMIYSNTSVTFEEGDTVFDVLLREMRANKIHMEYSSNPAYDSAYLEGIGNLYEFDCGELSGWMYCVNGTYPKYGCSQYQVSPGDKIEWHYTCDLGKDLGQDVK